MPKTRMMGAGLAGSTAYFNRVNGDQGGGMKLQGLAPTTNKKVQFVLRNIQNRAYGQQRDHVFCMNQIGGIGAVGSGNRSRAFATTADGVNKSQCKSGKHVFKPWIGTCAACSPGCDTNQCLKFSVTTEANQLQGPFKYINNCGELVESELQDIINQNTHIMNNVKLRPLLKMKLEKLTSTLLSTNVTSFFYGVR